MKRKTTTRFLLVEDDPMDRDLIEREFSHEGFVFRSVRDGAEAIDYVKGKGEFADRRRFPLPHVILLDLKMPRLNGFEFLNWLKHSPDKLCATPVVVMSSSADPQDIARAYQLGANGYMVKPITFKDFQERMRAMGALWTEMLETPEPSAA